MSDTPRTPITSGGLEISTGLGLSPKEEDTVTHRWDTLETVVDTLGEWGFKDAQNPKVECPTITPEMLLTPDVAQYTVLYSSQLRWLNYANKLEARVKAEMLQLKNEMEDIGAETRKRFRKENESKDKKDKLTDRAIDDEITTNPRYRVLTIRIQELQQMKYELDAQVAEQDSNMKVISRQVEIRKEETNGGNREQNMPGSINGRPWQGRNR